MPMRYLYVVVDNALKLNQIILEHLRFLQLLQFVDTSFRIGKIEGLVKVANSGLSECLFWLKATFNVFL